MYTIRFPAVPLRPFIECFWFLRVDIAPPERLEEQIFADARADIVINFGSPYLRLDAVEQRTQVMHRSNLDAHRCYPAGIFQQGQIDLVGIRLRPGGRAAFPRWCGCH